MGGGNKNYATMHLNDTNLKRLMCIVIERPEMKSVDFDEILNVFKE